MQRALRLLQKLPFQHIKVVRFFLSGGTAVTLNFVLLWTLTDLLHIWYLFSLVITILIGSVVNFTMQKFWTFENHSLERVHIQLPQFMALVLFNLVLNSAFLYALVEYGHLWYLAGQVICVGVLAGMNYFIYHRYIFIRSAPL